MAWIRQDVRIGETARIRQPTSIRLLVSVLLLASILLPVPGCSGPAADSTPPVHLFIFAGQSNMVGQGRVAELPDSLRAMPENVTLYVQGRRSTVGDRKTFGPEVVFAHRISERYPDRPIVLVKYAVGGTSLLAWDPSWTEEEAARTDNAEAGPLYRTLLGHVRDLAEAASDSHEVQFAALLWMQGERDARYPVAGRAYGPHLAELIRRLRSDLTAPDLPVVYGQVNPPGDRSPAAENVRSAQDSLSMAMDRVAMVSTRGLTKHPDELHYDTRGQIELGRRMAEGYIELVE